MTRRRVLVGFILAGAAIAVLTVRGGRQEPRKRDSGPSVEAVGQDGTPGLHGQRSALGANRFDARGELAALIRELLFSNEAVVAVKAHQHLMSVLEVEAFAPTDVGRLLLQELTADVRQQAPKLNNAELTARLVLAQIPPSPELMGRMTLYLSLAGQRAHTQPDAHDILAELLRDWGSDPDRTSRRTTLAQRLVASAGNPQALARLVDELLRQDGIHSLGSIADAMRAWATGTPVALDALIVTSTAVLQHGQDAQAAWLQELLWIADSLQLEAGDSALSVPVSHLGTTVGEALRRLSRDPALRASAVANILAHDSRFDGLGASLFLSVALGGAGDGDPGAVDRLSQLHEGGTSELLRRTALVNLGRVASVDQVLAATSVRLDAAPRSASEVLAACDLLAAIENARQRHPEESRLAATAYATLLRQDLTSDNGSLLLQRALQFLVERPLPELSDDMLEPFQASDDRRVRALAERAIERAREARK